MGIALLIVTGQVETTKQQKMSFASLTSPRPSVRSILRQCSALAGCSRTISTSSVRYARDKKDKGKEKTVVKKSTRKGEEETTKKNKLSPEAEMRVAVRRLKARSDMNPNKMTIDEAVKVLRVRISLSKCTTVSKIHIGC